MGEGSGIGRAELETCLRVLEALRGVPADDPDHLAVEQAAAHLRKSARKKRRLARRRAARERDRALIERAAMARDRREVPVEGVDEGGRLGELHNQRRCYVCKAPYREVHALYHGMCGGCGDFNQSMRTRRADLRGRRALVTGGRIKIGFELSLKLLRDGASVEITTRFPKDAARRFAAQSDAGQWEKRLKIHGLDLRLMPQVVAFCDRRASGEPLDILVNNAAQTVRRPPAFYRALAEGEGEPIGVEARRLLASGGEGEVALEIAEGLGRFHSLCLGADDPRFPSGQRDEEGLPLDLRALNSWVLKLDSVPPVELIETMLVGAMAPFVMCSRLEEAMVRSPFEDRYIVNVSAVEGQFGYVNKTAAHPHTNMTKAALNMLTRTAASDYKTRGIHMCSVDTGWITQENPFERRQNARERGFFPPLDTLDGAARVYDPVVRGVEQGEPVWGVFLKDYHPAPW